MGFSMVETRYYPISCISGQEMHISLISDPQSCASPWKSKFGKKFLKIFSIQCLAQFFLCCYLYNMRHKTVNLAQRVNILESSSKVLPVEPHSTAYMYIFQLKNIVAKTRLNLGFGRSPYRPEAPLL